MAASAQLISDVPMFFPDPSAAMTPDQRKLLSDLFFVDKDDITIINHPLSSDDRLLYIHYPVALNIPAAIARYLNENTDIYPQGTVGNYAEIPRTANKGAFIGGAPADRELFLTIMPRSLDAFIAVLQPHAANIAYAVDHPSILFTIRHGQPFRVAKYKLEHGFNPFVVHALG
jgi:hypothetical protein